RLAESTRDGMFFRRNDRAAFASACDDRGDVERLDRVHADDAAIDASCFQRRRRQDGVNARLAGCDERDVATFYYRLRASDLESLDGPGQIVHRRLAEP